MGHLFIQSDASLPHYTVLSFWQTLHSCACGPSSSSRSSVLYAWPLPLDLRLPNKQTQFRFDSLGCKKHLLFWTGLATHLNYALFLSLTSYFCDLLSDLIIDVMILGNSNAFLNKIKYLITEAFDVIC